MYSCDIRFSLKIKVVVCLILKYINQYLNKLYLEYISVGIYYNINDEGDPPIKRSRDPLNKYNIGPKRPRETASIEQLSMLNAEKITLIMTEIFKNMIGL